MNKAPISEIFSSIQGEGILVGVKQIFIRFSGCNIERCAFCDERTNKRSFKTVKEVMTVLEKFRQREKFHSMSLTGGEALLYPDFLRQLCKELKKEKILIYLETNGTLVDNLKFIKNYLDFIAMDIKLPSSTLRRSYFNEHEKFLKVSPRKKTFIKVVVTKGTKFSCFKKAVTLVKKIDKKTCN